FRGSSLRLKESHKTSHFFVRIGYRLQPNQLHFFAGALLDEVDGTLAAQFRGEVAHQAGVDQKDRFRGRAGNLDHADGPRLVLEETPWSQEDKAENQRDNDVVLPAGTRELPKQQPAHGFDSQCSTGKTERAAVQKRAKRQLTRAHGPGSSCAGRTADSGRTWSRACAGSESPAAASG